MVKENYDNIRKGYERKSYQLSVLSKYADIIDGILSQYNKKSCQETMMIKGYRKSSEESTVRKTHMEDHAAMAAYAAEQIGLNAKIVRIMAKHHDIGHTFLGHSGEWWFSNIKEDYGIGYYCHNAIGTRELEYGKDIHKKIIDEIKFFNPQISEDEIQEIKDSLWLIFEAINSHNGEVLDREFIPNVLKTEEDYREEQLYCFTKKGYDKKIIPATPEAAIMRLCDKISYVASNITDGIAERIILGFDDEYVTILNQMGISEEEITQCSVNNDYSNISRRIKNIFLKDLIENSNKEKIAMSDEKATLMYKLLNKSDREIVDKIVLREDTRIYPKAIRALMNRYKNVIQENDLLEKIETIDEDPDIIFDLESKYNNTPDIQFIRYICQMNPKDFEFTKNMIKEASKQSIQDELDIAKDVVQNNETYERSTETRLRDWYRWKDARVGGYIKYFQSYFSKEEQYTEEQNEKDVEYIFKKIEEGSNNRSYLNIDERMGLELGAQYISSLNDREFMQTIRDTKLVNQKEYESLTRKYNQIDIDQEVGVQSNWKEIRQDMEKQMDKEER